MQALDGLKVLDLSVRFREEGDKSQSSFAVRRLSFDIKPGKIRALIGEGGAGRTVVNMAILRLFSPEVADIYEGQVWFGGRDLLAMDEKELKLIRGRHIAIIFQETESCLNPVYTAGSQVAEAIRLHKKISKKEAMRIVLHLFRQVGFSEPEVCINAYPHQLSSGMKQRVMISMALACDPQVLLADEPTAALDVGHRIQILDLFSSLAKKRGMGVLLMAQDLSLVFHYAHDISVMFAGEIIEHGDSTSIFERPKHPYTRSLMACAKDFSENILQNKTDRKLHVIEGADLPLKPKSKTCLYFDRCMIHKKECGETVVPLRDVSRDEGQVHQVRCLVDIPD